MGIKVEVRENLRLLTILNTWNPVQRNTVLYGISTSQNFKEATLRIEMPRETVSELRCLTAQLFQAVHRIREIQMTPQFRNPNRPLMEYWILVEGLIEHAEVLIEILQGVLPTGSSPENRKYLQWKFGLSKDRPETPIFSNKTIGCKPNKRG